MDNKSKIAELQNALRLQKGLQNITNQIDIAGTVKQIVAETRPMIVNLFRVEAANVYAVGDKNKKEIFTYFSQDDKTRERKTVLNDQTVPGYIVNMGKMVSITDFGDPSQLGRYPDFPLKKAADIRFGVDVRQILAMPIIYGGEILGAVEIINPTGSDGQFGDKVPAILQNIAEVLGIAFYNKQKIDPKAKRTKFGYLVANDLITEEELDKAKQESWEKREALEDVLMKKFGISKDEIGQSLEYFHQCPYVPFDKKRPIPGDLLKNLKKEYLMTEIWVPLEQNDKGIFVLIDDPQNILKRDAIENLLREKSVKYCVAMKEDILQYIEFFFRGEAEGKDFLQLLDKIEAAEGPQEEEGEEAIGESDSAIIQLVNRLIDDAFTHGASDIHIEPDVIDKKVLVRYRVDGDCGLYQTLPYSYRMALISRIKIMANLDITVKRVPQDGKIKVRKPGAGEIELRVVTVPTQGGVEDVVMRILAKGGALPLEAMNMTQRNFTELLRICEQPYGMILCVGPTGSGKTTLLHALLNHINKPDRKIWTAEDPVEITQRGLRQVQVQSKIGFDFAAAMRAFLRADPDVIMVGEMRDFETAKIGVEASLTGHLVLSTLHTNSAPETITRLLDMGIDPLNFADSLLGVMAQRLVRTLCNKCKEAYHPSEEEYQQIVEGFGREAFQKQNIPYTAGLTLYRPRGCEQCDNTGYKGRVGIHELLINSEAIKKQLTGHRANLDGIRDVALAEGMLTLYQDGVLKAFRGITDIKQVHRVCINTRPS